MITEYKRNKCPIVSSNSRMVITSLWLVFCDVMQAHPWVAKDGRFPMQSEEQNCHALVTVTHDDVTNSVKVIPRLETLVSMLTGYCWPNA